MSIRRDFLSMSNTSKFHISEEEKLSSPLAALSGPAGSSVSALLLPGEDGARSPGPGVHLVQHHVFQLLIVHGAKIDVCLQGLAGKKVRVLG